VLADKDHVFFEYQPKHTSDAACMIFKGFGGYIQANAHCIYDALFRGDALEEGERLPTKWLVGAIIRSCRAGGPDNDGREMA
jgi:hypothetical protein